MNTIEKTCISNKNIVLSTERVCQNCGKTFYRKYFSKYCMACRPIILRKNCSETSKKRRQRLLEEKNTLITSSK